MPSSSNELKTTLFLTPVISHFFRLLSLLLIKILRWRIVGEKPSAGKYIVIAAPHTSNWDFAMFLMAAFILRFDAHWMGKDALFPAPVRRLMIWLGGIPIDRSKANNVVDQMVEYFNDTDDLTVLITPEGTRSKVVRWKTGFYHIALKANIPIVLGFIDGGTKSLGFGPLFYPSGDLAKDMEEIQDYYKNFVGLNPKNF